MISEHITPSQPFNNDKIALAIIQHRNTPLPDLKLSPAQILLHRQLRDMVPSHPKHFRLHKEWILTSKQREHLFKAKNDALMKRHNLVSRSLNPLLPRTKVFLLLKRIQGGISQV